MLRYSAVPMSNVSTLRKTAPSDQLVRVALSASPVLIRGETGTGKSRLAQRIHRESGRSGPFVTVALASIPETLLEDELFGHEAGAFTGATGARDGKVEEARGGTLFLDEVGDLTASAQTKLLRVLQERTFQRIGSNSERKAEFRLICATHRDLETAVAERTFREDLYFRIRVVEFTMEPLRGRPEEILQLASLFLEEFSKREGRRGVSIGPEALSALKSYLWPGNVRELEHVIERAVVLAADNCELGADIVAPRPVRRVFTPEAFDAMVGEGRGLDRNPRGRGEEHSSDGPAPVSGQPDGGCSEAEASPADAAEPLAQARALNPARAAYSSRVRLKTTCVPPPSRGAP